MIKDNYEIVYNGLVNRLADMDFKNVAMGIGGRLEGDGLNVRLLNISYIITRDGVIGKGGEMPDVAIRILLCHYVLQAGQGEMTGEWVSYRDFRDAAFFISNFQANVEERLSRHFSGNIGGLKNAADRLGGRPFPEYPGADISYHFQFLPRFPVLLVFYDQDDEFPASAKILFDRSAPLWLDMECLSATGGILADQLIKAAERSS